MSGILQSEIALLRPWRVEDARWYVEARDEEIFRWTTEGRELTVEETERAIQQVNSGGNAFCFAIVDVKTNALVGNIALELQGEDFKEGELHYWLSRLGRGRGIATESVKLLARWAFGVKGLKRVFLKTFEGNTRSQRVAERAGFHRTEPPNASQAGEWVWFALEWHGHADETA